MMKIRTIALLIFCCFIMIGIVKAQAPVIRFGIIADIQYADKNNGPTRFYRNSIGKMDSCIADLNREQLSFNVIFGDLVDEGPKDLYLVMDKLKRLKAKYKNVLGNHDYVGVEDKEKLYQQFNMPASNYIFEKENWMFIVLNTNEVSAYGANSNSPLLKEWKNLTDSLKNQNRKNAQPWNGGISLKQLQWLEANLVKAKSKNKKVLIFSHHPLFPETGLEALNNRQILSVIEKYDNVKGLMAGHHHEGGFAFYNKIPAITLEGMVETTQQNAYGVVELYTDKMVIIGRGRLTSRTLNF